jgi:hypothetical protein
LGVQNYCKVQLLQNTLSKAFPTHATVASTIFDDKSLFFAFVVVSFRDFLLLEGYLDIIFRTTFPIKPDNHIELASSSASSPRDNIG